MIDLLFLVMYKPEAFKIIWTFFILVNECNFGTKVFMNIEIQSKLPKWSPFECCHFISSYKYPIWLPSKGRPPVYRGQQSSCFDSKLNFQHALGNHFGQSHDFHPGILTMASESQVTYVHNNSMPEAKEAKSINVIYNWQFRYRWQKSKLFKHVFTVIVLYITSWNRCQKWLQWG